MQRGEVLLMKSNSSQIKKDWVALIDIENVKKTQRLNSKMFNDKEYKQTKHTT